VTETPARQIIAAREETTAESGPPDTRSEVVQTLRAEFDQARAAAAEGQGLLRQALRVLELFRADFAERESALRAELEHAEATAEFYRAPLAREARAREAAEKRAIRTDAPKRIDGAGWWRRVFRRAAAAAGAGEAVGAIPRHAALEIASAPDRDGRRGIEARIDALLEEIEAQRREIDRLQARGLLGRLRRRSP
jgi:hypothetical protein